MCLETCAAVLLYHVYLARNTFCDCCCLDVHFNCVNNLVHVFLCSRSTVKLQTNFHRHNYAEPDPDNKPVQTGTAVFIKELKSRHFPRYVPFNLVITVHHKYLNLDDL